jgi:bifunctional DNA-binding transcriptional regulator/antitoxin component of YhaV-PrlF toxin-antitoxin module
MARPRPIVGGPVTVRAGFQIVPPPEVRRAVRLGEGDVVWFYAYEGDSRILLVRVEPPKPEGFLPPPLPADPAD